MSLTDLKKSKTDKGKKKSFTVDEFISDSENYAKGTPEIVNEGKPVVEDVDLAATIADAQKMAENKVNTPSPQVSSAPKPPVVGQAVTPNPKYKQNRHFKHATFTLSKEVIEELNRMSVETKLAKSLIIRLLINHTSDQDLIDLAQDQSENID
ncbi:hypothetical protein [Thalassotalea agarivorans]|uniref:Ribbon-helix-helix protein, copG family n=1 Tax=Thalassotalea agarivorans TaxID=349064 RepID=A0A1I0CN02_THASX|nr:hypothetical protein [Thalassotalea agarivorans]SET20620.1 hypothetical protein SAMN05660429_01248 [Thalassotalea agarivorans]